MDTPTVISGNTFTNPGAITIPDGSPGNSISTPYPSNLFVSGFSGTLTKVTLNLNNLTLASADYVDMLLVAPNGAKFVPFSHVGGVSAVGPINLVLDDAAGSALPDSTQLTSGTFRPAAYSTSGVVFPAPAPASPGFASPAGAATFASSFNGISPNGTWKLFATSRLSPARPEAERADGGFIGGGTIGSWGLTFTVPAVPMNFVVDTTVDDVALNACTAAAGDCSLRGAIANANANGGNDTITFDAGVFGSAQTINIGANGELVITNNGSLTIQGPGASVVTVSGNNTSNVFKIASGTVTIDGITVATGRIGIWNLGTLNLINSIVSGNTTVGIFNTGTMTITDSTISGNSNSTTYGIAGIYTTATMTITGSTISNNSATNFQSDGGGIGLYGGFLTITRSIITGNSGEYAGGIQLFGGSGVLITDTTISGNTARQGGGGISKWISSSSVPISIVNSTISGNTAGLGAGINTWASPVTITNSTISNNSASYKGGGIYMVDSSTQLKVTNSTITGNRANTGDLGGDGGGSMRSPSIRFPTQH